MPLQPAFHKQKIVVTMTRGSPGNAVSADSLSRLIEEFLLDHPHSAVLEDGALLFDLSKSRYSVTDSSRKALLHLWSDERNTVRRVVEAELRSGCLLLAVQKFGKSKVSQLEICPVHDSRTASAARAARAGYRARLERLLARDYQGWQREHVSAAMDLEHSFGPTYTRLLLRRGNSAFAVLGVNATESQASVDASLTFGLLWLDLCRQNAGKRLLVEGLKLFVPAGTSEVVRHRMAHLDRGIARWELFEVAERQEQITPIDSSDAGNIATRLVHAPDRAAALDRFASSIEFVRDLCPEAEAIVCSGTEIAFRIHGLQFAGARLAVTRDSFRPAEQLYFGTGAAEYTVDDSTRGAFRDYVLHVAERRTSRDRSDPIHRAVPERWLESLLVADVTVLDSRLDGEFVYSQVPAFAATDRAVIDILTATREGRLAVLELKADEDIHLPLQGLDYWARVRWHHQRREFQQFGYFPGRELSPDDPLLLLVAPALRIHPTTDRILRYLSPEIRWTFLAIDERWRDGVRVVFRKHSPRVPE